MSNTDNTLPEELQKEIEQQAQDIYGEGCNHFQVSRKAHIAGATEYAPYKERCEKALQYIGEMHSSGCIELNNYHINEIKSFLDGTK